VTLTVDASDNVGVAEVEYFADGTSIGKASAAPFSLDWATTSVANGAHTLTATARDAASNATTSDPVAVNVANATLTQLQNEFFGPICSACHNGSNPLVLPGSMNLTTPQQTYSNTVNVSSQQDSAQKRIQPGSPDTSYLVRKVEGDPGISGSRMPRGCPGTQPCLSDAEIQRLRDWVNAGALNN
jgi:hypothetical protein